MKKAILIPAVMLTVMLALLGMKPWDGGDCARIYAEFTLTTGEVVHGYTHTDRLDFENADRNLKAYLHHSVAGVKVLDSITVFGQIDTLTSIRLKGQREHCAFYYLACPAEKVTVLGFEDWVGGTLKRQYPCQACSSPGAPYAAGGYSPAIITELTAYEIEKLKGKSALKYCDINTSELTTLYLVSLKGDHTRESLERLYKKLSGTHDYAKLKAALRALDIAMFSIYWTA